MAGARYLKDFPLLRLAGEILDLVYLYRLLEAI